MFRFHFLTFILFNIKTASSPVIVNTALNPGNLLVSSDFSLGGDVRVVSEIGDVIMVGDDEGVEDIVGVWVTVAVGVGVIGMVVGVCTGVVATIVAGGVVGVVGVCSITSSILHVPLLISIAIGPEVDSSSPPARPPISSKLTPSFPIA